MFTDKSKFIFNTKAQDTGEKNINVQALTM